MAMIQLDQASLAALEEEVYEDEAILWAARPNRIRFARRAAKAFLLGALLASIAVLWMFGVTRWGIADIPHMTGPVAAIVVALLLAAFLLLACPLWMWFLSGRMIYAVTDTRAIVLTQGWRTGVCSFDAEDMRYVHIRQGRGGAGDVVFHSSGPYPTDGFPQDRNTGFLAIDDLAGAEAALWQIDGFRKPLTWRASNGVGWVMLAMSLIPMLMGGHNLSQLGWVKTLTFTRQAGRVDCLVWQSWAGLTDGQRTTITGVQGAEGRLVVPPDNGDCGDPWYEIGIKTAAGDVPVVVADVRAWPDAKRITRFVADREVGPLRIVSPAERGIMLIDLVCLIVLCLGIYLLTAGLQGGMDELRRRPLRRLQVPAQAH
jgi:hypothetical protein